MAQDFNRFFGGVLHLGWEGVEDPAEREAARQRVLQGYLPNNPPALEQQRRDTVERNRLNSYSPFLQEQAAEVQRPQFFEPGDAVRVNGRGNKRWHVRSRTIEMYGNNITRVEYEVVEDGKTYPLTLTAAHAMLSLIDTAQEETKPMYAVGTKVTFQNLTRLKEEELVGGFALFFLQQFTGSGVIERVDTGDDSLPYLVKFENADHLWLPAWALKQAPLAVGDFVQIDTERYEQVYGRPVSKASRGPLVRDGVIGVVVEYDGSRIPYKVRWDYSDGLHAGPSWIQDVLKPADLSALPEGSIVVVSRISTRRDGDLHPFVGMRGRVVATDETDLNTGVEFASGDHCWFYREELYLAEKLEVEMDQRVILTGSGLDKAIEQIPDKADFFNEVFARELSGLVFDVSPIRGTFMACFKSQRGSAGCHHISLSAGDFKIAPEGTTPANGDQDPVQDASSLPVGTRVRPNENGVARLSAIRGSSTAIEVAQDRLIGVISGELDEDGDYEVMWGQIEDFWWLKPSELEVVPERTPEHQAAVDAFLAASQAVVDAVDDKARMNELMALSNQQYVARNNLMRFAVRS